MEILKHFHENFVKIFKRFDECGAYGNARMSNWPHRHGCPGSPHQVYVETRGNALRQAPFLPPFLHSLLIGLTTLSHLDHISAAPRTSGHNLESWRGRPTTEDGIRNWCDSWSERYQGQMEYPIVCGPSYIALLDTVFNLALKSRVIPSWWKLAWLVLPKKKNWQTSQRPNLILTTLHVRRTFHWR